MKRILLIITALSLTLAASAKLVLPPQVGDYMVLQQQAQARLWGWADPGTRVDVTVSWDGRKYSARADRDGAWSLEVATPEGSFTEYTVTLAAGKEELTLRHVLVGEVWLGSGQSNMEMTLRGFDNCPVEGAMREVAGAGRYRGRIRIATLPKTDAYSPRKVTGGPWLESAPENVLGFSAAAWFFAKTLTEVLDVPVGVITNAWGGSRVEGWLPKEIVSTYPGVASDSLAIRRIFQMHRPTVMYYGQWAPVRNYTFRGVIWYQGETNVDMDPTAYAERMETLIALWRKETGKAALPVYQVEIAPYAAYGDGADGTSAALLREQQWKASDETENCWTISTADLVLPFETDQIHPARKREVGERLGWMALHHTYGKTYFPGVAPTYKSCEVNGREMILTFDHIRETGGYNLWNAVQGLEICGPDGIWHPAQAHVVNFRQTLSVSSPEVEQPVAVRYAFRNWLPGNLTGASGLAVPPFRTDAQ